MSIVLKQGDITQEDVDVIVNAANSALAGGGGVDGAIHRAGGPSIMAELDALRPSLPDGRCATGSAVMTGAGNLAAKHVVHAVGPRWQGGTRGEAELLRSAYLTSLRLASEARAETVAFPSISTGIYGFPIEQAAPIALQAIREFLDGAATSVAEVRMVLFSEDDLAVYQRVAG